MFELFVAVAARVSVVGLFEVWLTGGAKARVF